MRGQAAHEGNALIKDHPCLQTSIAREDKSLEAQTETAESLSVEAAKQPAERDKLMESFMSGALEVKTFNGRLPSPCVVDQVRCCLRAILLLFGPAPSCS